MTNAAATEDETARTVIVAVGVNAAVTVAKAVAAGLSGSAAMFAETAHSLADTANEVPLYVGVRTSARRRAQPYPTGSRASPSASCSPAWPMSWSGETAVCSSTRRFRRTCSPRWTRRSGHARGCMTWSTSTPSELGRKQMLVLVEVTARSDIAADALLTHVETMRAEMLASPHVE